MIVRDLEAASRREFDLVIIGGGIYGVSLLREAARRGLSACLCEAGDFGGGTSWNSLRIVHGGLRYLQTLDLPRFFQSVASRRQFARQFPTLVRPLPCLMPLYGQGMKRLSVMRMALLLNDLLSSHRNHAVPAAVHLPPGGVLAAPATVARLPSVRRERLEGAAQWSDLFMVSSERILMELLRDACRHGGLALNYAPVEGLETGQGEVRGLRVRDALSGGDFVVAGRKVINCAGPKVAGVAPAADSASAGLFRPSLAFNLLLDVSLPPGQALAVAAPEPGAPMLFVVAQQGTLLAGTLHLPRPAGTTEAVPTEAEIGQYLAQLNAAIPGLGARRENVRRVFAGLLPAAVEGSNELAKREVLVDHGATGSLRNYFSVSGVKWTTAGDVACQVLKLAGLGAVSLPADEPLQLAPSTPTLTDAREFAALDDGAAAQLLRQLRDEESVEFADDVVLRRTNWATTEPELAPLLERVARLMSVPLSSVGGLKCE